MFAEYICRMGQDFDQLYDWLELDQQREVFADIRKVFNTIFYVFFRFFLSLIGCNISFINGSQNCNPACNLT